MGIYAEETDQWHVRVGSGAGFLIDRQHVMTCAHLIGVSGTVPVILQDLTKVTAEVAFRGSWSSGAKSSVGDLAVLRLPRAVDLRPAAFAPFSAVETYADAPLTAFGYPKGHEDDGLPAKFQITSRSRMGGELYLLTPLAGEVPLMAKGFSGAAIVQPDSNQVVGMFVAVAKESGSALGQMLPTDVMERYWAPLAERVPLGQFSPAAYAELRRLLQGLSPDHVRGLADAAQRSVGSKVEQPTFRSVLHVAEWLVTVPAASPETAAVMLWACLKKIADDLQGAAAQALLKEPQAAKNAALKAWSDRYLWPSSSISVRSPAAGASIVVRIKPAVGPELDADDPSNEIGIWTATEPGGGLDDPPVFSGTVSESRTPEVVMEKVQRALTDQLADHRGVALEFVLPRGRLGDPVEQWLEPGWARKVWLGWKRPVVVRDLARFEDRFARDLTQRADAMRADDLRLMPQLSWKDCTTPVGREEQFTAYVLNLDDKHGLALTGSWAQHDHIEFAVETGLPVLLWRRSRCGDHECEASQTCSGIQLRDLIQQHLAARPDDGLPQLVRYLRGMAASDEAEYGCAADISLLWDDPRRRPQFQFGYAS